MRNRLRRHVGLAAAVLTATGVLAGAADAGFAGEVPSAAAGPVDALVAAAPDGLPVGFATWEDVFAEQSRLNAAARQIVAARGAGYAGIVAAPENHDLRVYWKGEVPASVRTLASRLGMPVRFLPARYTEREMLAEVHRLARDPQVLSVGPEVDGSGLTVTVTAAGRRSMSSGRGAVGRTMMPLHQEFEAASVPLGGFPNGERQNDTSPYWGGSYFNAGGGCTTGVSILLNGVARMLTSGHCADNGDIAIDGASDVMGEALNDDNTRDTVMIKATVPGENFDPFIYTGPFDSDTGTPVVGAAEDFVGNVVCKSGARTGESCGLRVSDVNVSDAGFFPMVRANSGRNCGAAEGDSGGPVFTKIPGGGVIARGTLSTAIVGTARCPNAPPEQSGRVVHWAPLLRPPGDATVGALQFYGATML